MLSLELVKKELEVNNYSPVIHKISNKEILLFSVEDEDKIPIMNKISNVVIENENIVLTYFKKQFLWIVYGLYIKSINNKKTKFFFRYHLIPIP